MRDAVIISLVFHVVVMASGMIAMPMFRPDKAAVMNIIPVEMVKIGDMTKLKAQEKEPEPVKKKTPPKKDKPKRKVEMPPEPPKLASTMPLPDMKTKPKPKKKAEPKKPVKLAANRAPKVTPKSKPRRFNAGKLAALLDKREEAEPDLMEKLKDKDYGKEKVISTLDLQQQTLSIIDAIDKHIFDNPRSRDRLNGRKILIASTDVHANAITIIHELLSGAGAKVTNLGAEINPDQIARAAKTCDAEAILVSTHNGMALEYANRLKAELNGQKVDIPVVIGGILNQKVDGEALPVDVTTNLKELGFYPSPRLGDSIQKLLENNSIS